ncbi:MAG: ATP-binding protein [Anaerolineae bacterium]
MARIIVVDDEHAVRELFGFWLEEAGHNVRLAASADDARELLESAPSDVLVTDIRMARTTGIDLLTWSRQHDPDMPVVLVTGRPGVDTAVDALRLGAYDYLVKPVGGGDLTRVVGRAAAHRLLLSERAQLEARNRRYQALLEQRVAERTRALSRRNSQLLLLQDVADSISALDDIDALFRRLVDNVHEAFGYSEVSVFVVDRDAAVVRLEAIAGAQRDSPALGYAQPIDTGLVGAALGERQPVVVNDVRADPRFLRLEGRDVLSEAVFPVSADGEVAALLVVAETSVGALDDTDVVVMRTLSEHLGVAVSNSLLYAQLQDALEARDNMLANVSHELRSPLSVISAWAEMLYDETVGAPDDDAHRAAASILSSAQHLTHLVNLLLTNRQLESEELALRALQVGSWLESSVGAWKPVFDRAGLQLRLEVEPGVGHVMASSEYLQQVLNNLLDNVRKFSPEGATAVISASRVGDEVHVAVRDDGIGVSAERLPRLFERFYQVDSGEARRYGGMGLGLSVSHDIIERHGGRMWAESGGEGRGLTMTFALPVAGAVFAEDDSDGSRPGAATPRERG